MSDTATRSLTWQTSHTASEASALRRAGQVFRAFFYLGYSETLAYPLAFILTQLAPLMQPVIYAFVARLVDNDPAVGGDYYAFAILGIITMRVLGGGLEAFGNQLTLWVNQGRFETLLIEPVSWRVIPFGMVVWPITLRLITASMMLIIAIAMGADLELARAPLALLVVFLGIAASHAVALLAGSVLILSKRADPIIVLYQLATALLSGVLFPVDLLPSWLRVLSHAIPNTYVLGAVRRLLMPGGDEIGGAGITTSILALLAFIIVMYPIAIALYSRSLGYARRVGILAGY